MVIRLTGPGWDRGRLTDKALVLAAGAAALIGLVRLIEIVNGQPTMAALLELIGGGVLAAATTLLSGVAGPRSRPAMPSVTAADRCDRAERRAPIAGVLVAGASLAFVPTQVSPAAVAIAFAFAGALMVLPPLRLLLALALSECPVGCGSCPPLCWSAPRCSHLVAAM